MLNTAILKSPVNWFILFFMVLIPILGFELVSDRAKNGCGCGN